MGCSTIRVLSYTSIILIIIGFIATVISWFAPSIYRTVNVIRICGPLILISGLAIMTISCFCCAYSQGQLSCHYWIIDCMVFSKKKDRKLRQIQRTSKSILKKGGSAVGRSSSTCLYRVTDSNDTITNTRYISGGKTHNFKVPCHNNNNLMMYGNPKTSPTFGNVPDFCQFNPNCHDCYMIISKSGYRDMYEDYLKNTKHIHPVYKNIYSENLPPYAANFTKHDFHHFGDANAMNTRTKNNRGSLFDYSNSVNELEVKVDHSLPNSKRIDSSEEDISTGADSVFTPQKQSSSLETTENSRHDYITPLKEKYSSIDKTDNVRNNSVVNQPLNIQGVNYQYQQSQTGPALKNDQYKDLKGVSPVMFEQLLQSNPKQFRGMMYKYRKSQDEEEGEYIDYNASTSESSSIFDKPSSTSDNGNVGVVVTDNQPNDVSPNLANSYEKNPEVQIHSNNSSHEEKMPKPYPELHDFDEGKEPNSHVCTDSPKITTPCRYEIERSSDNKTSTAMKTPIESFCHTENTTDLGPVDNKYEKIYYEGEKISENNYSGDGIRSSRILDVQIDTNDKNRRQRVNSLRCEDEQASDDNNSSHSVPMKVVVCRSHEENNKGYYYVTC